jgi:hypothetical protein
LEKDFVNSAEVIDRPDGDNGKIMVILDTSREETEKEVKDQIHSIKAAGVFFDLVFTTKVFPTYTLTLTPSKDLSESEKEGIRLELKEGIKSYLVGLKPSATVIASKVLSIAMGIKKVEAAEITDVSVWPPKADIRRLPNNDLLIGKFYKATAKTTEKDEIPEPVDVHFKSAITPAEPPPTIEVPTQQLRVEAYIYVKINDPSLNEIRTGKAIEASTRSYLSNLFAEDGDVVNFYFFLEAIKTTKSFTKYGVSLCKYVIRIAEQKEEASFEQDAKNYTFLRLVHSADGLERILFHSSDSPDDSHKEEIRIGEVIGDPKIFVYFEYAG